MTGFSEMVPKIHALAPSRMSLGLSRISQRAMSPLRSGVDEGDHDGRDDQDRDDAGRGVGTPRRPGGDEGRQPARTPAVRSAWDDDLGHGRQLGR